MRLTRIDTLPASITRPAYDPTRHEVGIVHIGLGAFHKAHQAVYTDDALAADGGDWRIAGISLRGYAAAEALAPQNGLFTVIEQGISGRNARVIGSIASALSLARDRNQIVKALTSPATRIVSLTVTEKGYGLDRATGDLDIDHPAIATDLRTPEVPVGVAGLFVDALGRRKANGIAPFTVLSCDNLPENGAFARRLLIAYANRVRPDLAEHIAQNVACPSTMVDRITPAQTDATLALAQELTGRDDAAAIETELFRQWVIEDHFPQGRPAWDAGGAIFTTDVRPYETMKLRMLNGAHSMLAYAGHVAGHRYVRDVMQDADLAQLVRRHMTAASATLSPVEGLRFSDYADALVERFTNPHLAHETYQIAMDGTEKLPQRILVPAAQVLERGGDLAPFAFAVAGWMRYCLGHTEDGAAYLLRDPREDQLRAQLSGADTAEAIVSRLHSVAGVFPDALTNDNRWCQAVQERLDRMLRHGICAAIRYEADTGKQGSVHDT
ncbi:MAG: mannitol dehydrogenase family protein [Pseudomonadota bacterium]